MLTHGWYGSSPDYFHTSRQFIDPITGKTALHTLMGQRVRFGAVENFLRCYAESSDRKPGYLIHQTTSLGATALHVALQRNSWELLEIVQALLAAAPELATIPMRYGVYPLHIACAMNLREETRSKVITTLLESYPEAAGLKDCNGETPLSLFNQNMATHYKESFKDKKQARDMLLTALQIARTAVPNLTWHGLCSLKGCPPALIEFLSSPSSLAIKDAVYDLGPFRQTDTAGRMPLHCVAESSVDLSESANDSLLQVVLATDPGAAQHCDSVGRLALHCAVQNPELSSQSLLALAQAYPEALSRVDPVTGSYPAYTLAQSNISSMDVVYNLLRMDPTVVPL